MKMDFDYLFGRAVYIAWCGACMRFPQLCNCVSAVTLYIWDHESGSYSDEGVTK